MIDEMFATVLFATGAAVLFTGILVVASATVQHNQNGQAMPLSVPWTSVIVAGGVLLISLLWVIGAKANMAYRTATSGTEILGGK